MRLILVIMLLLVGGALGVAVVVPDDFRIERAASVEASPRKVASVIVDMRRFPRWSPWNDKATDVKRSFSGPAAGKGAAYQWKGDGRIREGRMEVASTAASRRVNINLDLVRPFEPQGIEIKKVPPFKMSTTSEFGIVERGGATVVTWTMRGKYTLVDKLKSVVAQLDQSLGYELELGLSRLKKIAES